jgi:hypothetical protein
MPRTAQNTRTPAVPATKKVIQLSAYQPKTKSSPTPQNEVNFPLHGECGELAKSPVNVGSQGIPDTPPLANSVEPGDGDLGEVNKTNVLPPKHEASASPLKQTKVKAKAKAKPDFLHLRTPGPDGYKTDCDKMLFTKLKAAYPHEETSWRGNKNKCNNPAGSKKKFAWEPWPAEWNEFKDFLRDMKPKPSPKHTLNRLDNSLRKYGPGLCEWALPEAQNNNKSDNVPLVDPLNGKKWTPKKLANLHGISVNTIYKRISSLWTITELVFGKQSQYLRDIYLLLDALPDLKPPGKKVVHRPITSIPSLDEYLLVPPAIWSSREYHDLNNPKFDPLGDPHPELEVDEALYEDLGILRRQHHAEICGEHDAVVDWVNAFNAGDEPMPPYPNLKYLKLKLPPPETVALRFTPIPPRAQAQTGPDARLQA